MWEKTLDRLLRRLIVLGRLRLRWPDGTDRSYGPGGSPDVAARLTDRAILRHLCLDPVMALGEGYMNGQIVVQDDALVDLMTLLVRNRQAGALPVWVDLADRVRGATMRWLQRNDPRTSQRNVAHHYDLSDDLYALFLDEDWQYSCAYFTQPDMSLEAAQAAKKAHIAAKLRIEPGMRVLDIGCGWGGMALTLARDHGARVTGVTLSRNQLARGQARVAAAGLTDRIDLRLMDYRDLDEDFDRIVSVGMLEHVGLPQFGTYFEKVRDLLGEDGIALIHSIVKAGSPKENNSWINKYIFPGSYAPAASEIFIALQNAGLIQQDDECLRVHYAHTLDHWLDRFQRSQNNLPTGFDARFKRMWKFYLTTMSVSFRVGSLLVHQVQVGKSLDSVNITREYISANT